MSRLHLHLPGRTRTSLSVGLRSRENPRAPARHHRLLAIDTTRPSGAEMAAAPRSLSLECAVSAAPSLRGGTLALICRRDKAAFDRGNRSSRLRTRPPIARAGAGQQATICNNLFCP